MTIELKGLAVLGDKFVEGYPSNVRAGYKVCISLCVHVVSIGATLLIKL